MVELTVLDWDIILFSETRVVSQTVELDGGHRLYLHREEYTASGVGALIHVRLLGSIRSTHFVSDRVLRVVLQLAQRKISFCAVYLPHAGYIAEALDQVYEQVHQTLTQAVRDGYATVVGGDFNSQWGFGVRGQEMAEMAAAFNLKVVNGEGHGRDEHSWTFKSSLGQVRRIDFIFTSSYLHASTWNISEYLDLGSDHRAVFVELLVGRTPRRRTKGPRSSMRGWTPFEDDVAFQMALDERLRNHAPSSLFEAEAILLDTAAAHGEGACSKRRWFNDQPWDSPHFQDLLQQRRHARDPNQRRELSKTIRKHIRT